MSRVLATAALALIVATATAPAAAAENPPARAAEAKSAPSGAKPGADAKAAPDGKTEPPAPPLPPPPYEAALLRLAEMMGALAYLRDLCGHGDGKDFRARMEGLVQAEGLGDSTRDLIAGAYNDAWRGYAESYQTCTPAAGEVIDRFLTETARLAADVASRYGG